MKCIISNKNKISFEATYQTSDTHHVVQYIQYVSNNFANWLYAKQKLTQVPHFAVL